MGSLSHNMHRQTVGARVEADTRHRAGGFKGGTVLTHKSLEPPQHCPPESSLPLMLFLSFSHPEELPTPLAVEPGKGLISPQTGLLRAIL